MMTKDRKATADAVIQRFAAKSDEFESMKTLWQDIAVYIQPRSANITSKTNPPNFDKSTQLFTSTAIRAKDTLTRGMVSMMIPAQSPWFAYDPPARLKRNDKAKAWYDECTEIIRAELGNSNFDSEAHEWLDILTGFGPAAMHVETGKKNLFNFTNLAIGSFAIAENDEGYVDTVWVCMPMTVRQVVQKFGINNVSPKTREAYNEEGGKRMGQKVEVIHEIRPRVESEYEPGKLGRENMPIASCYVEKAECHLLEEGGYAEMPTLVARFLKAADSVYGWAPSWYILPDSRQLNFLEKMLDALAEKAAFPPTIAPASMEGITTIDVRANGVTYVEPDENAILREWQSTGRYDIGKDRVLLKEEAIKQGYFTDVFRVFTDMERDITAYEAAQIKIEKIDQFSASVTRLTTEFFNPLLLRIWSIAIRAGILPPPPQEVFQQGADGQFYLDEPEIAYMSRIALAIKQIENVGLLQTLQSIEALLPLDPSLLDWFDFDIALPDMSRNNGMPARWIRSEDNVIAIRQARAEAAQRAQQLQEAQIGAQTAADLGSVSSDSLLAKAAAA